MNNSTLKNLAYNIKFLNTFWWREKLGLKPRSKDYICTKKLGVDTCYHCELKKKEDLLK